MKKCIKRNKESGFTLVELLAVIVILAIILVIAVPKVMSVIEDSKKATLESTAKMIASSAEKAKVQNQVLGNTKEIKCEDIVKMNDVDYESCIIEFEGDTAKVTLIGKGKFAGLNVCNGTKANSSGVNTSCGEVCELNEEEKLYSYVKSVYYEVDDISTCAKFLEEKVSEIINDESENLCEADISLYLGVTLNNLIEYGIKDGIFTKEELVNYQVAIKPYEVDNIPSCVSVIKERLNSVGATEMAAAVEPICNGQEVNGYTFDSAISMLIDDGVFTETELVENNILKIGRVIKPEETEEVKVCMPTKRMNGVTYLTNLVENENARKAFGITKDDTPDKNIRYAGFKPSNKVYFNCTETDSNNVAYGEDTYDYANSCEIWRIIGVFNTYSSQTDITGTKRIKIVRDELLDYCMEWDTILDGVRINQWGETTLKDGTIYKGASLKQYLNDGEDSYYSSLSSIAKGQMRDALWYTGVVENGIANEVYASERSNIAPSGETLNYTTNWVGKIGLIYPSDFGYAGTNCGNRTLKDYVFEDSCGEKSNWLTPINGYWTISPAVGRSDSNAFSSWSVSSCAATINSAVQSEDFKVRPALYLDPNIEIIGGDGGATPFKLSF